MCLIRLFSNKFFFYFICEFSFFGSLLYRSGDLLGLMQMRTDWKFSDFRKFFDFVRIWLITAELTTVTLTGLTILLDLCLPTPHASILLFSPIVWSTSQTSLFNSSSSCFVSWYLKTPHTLVDCSSLANSATVRHSQLNDFSRRRKSTVYCLHFAAIKAINLHYVWDVNV